MIKSHKLLSKAVLASTLIWANQALAVDITTDTTSPFTLDAGLATASPLNIKAVGGSITVSSAAAVKAQSSTAALTTTLTVENSATKLPAAISSDQQAIFLSSNNAFTLKIDVQKGATIQTINPTTGATKFPTIGTDGTKAAGVITLTLNNSGTIRNTGTDPLSGAILLGNHVDKLNFSNTSSGVIAAGSLASVGIDIDAINTSIDSFVNAGVISAPGGTAIKSTTLAIPNFTNSGTISGKGTVLDFGIIATDVNLTGGSITADLPTSIAAITAGNINITGGAMVGQLVNTGAGNVVNINVGTGKTFSTGGDIDSFASVKVQSGTLNLGHNITTSGDLIVQPGATLVVSRPVSLAGAGSLLAANPSTLPNVLTFDFTSNALFGQLTIPGAATDIGGTVLAVTNNGNGYIADNSVFTVLTAPAIAVTGAAPTFRLPTSAVYNFSAVRNPTNVVVTVRRTPLNSFGNSAEDSRLIGGVGSALEMLAQTTTNADVLRVVGELGRLSSGAQVIDALKQLVPPMNDMQLQAVVHSANLSFEHIRNRMRSAQLGDEAEQAGYAAGGFNDGRAVWAQTYGSHATQSNRKGTFGYTTNTLGLLIGTDSEVANDVRLGFSAGYSTSDSRTRRDARNEIDTDAYQLSAYVSKAVGCGWFDAALSYARLSFDGVRRIRFGAINAIATNNHHGSQWATTFGYAHHFTTDGGLNVIPSVHFDWVHVTDNPYIERGAGGLNLQVQSHNSEDVNVNADVSFGTSFEMESMTVTPDVNVGVKVAFLDWPEKLSATFLQTGPTFRVIGPRTQILTGTAGLGLNMAMSDKMSLKASYDMNLKTKYVSHTGSLSVRYLF